MSIGSFGLPLHNLLRSIRRTASNIVRDAIDMREASVGRFAFDAGRIDIEVHSLVTSCGGIQGVVTMQLPPQGTQIPLSFDDLTERATDRVLEDIEKESRGVLRNNSVPTIFRFVAAGHHTAGNIPCRLMGKRSDM